MTGHQFIVSLIVSLFTTASALGGAVDLHRIQSAQVPAAPPAPSPAIEKPLAWQNPANAFDVNHDSFVSPFDALLIINEVNAPQWSNPKTGLLPMTPLPADPVYFDVSGNNLVSALDAMLVLEHLNLQSLPTQTVPEPSAIVLGALGVVALIVQGRSKSRTDVSTENACERQGLAMATADVRS